MARQKKAGKSAHRSAPTRPGAPETQLQDLAVDRDHAVKGGISTPGDREQLEGGGGGLGGLLAQRGPSSSGPRRFRRKI
jgi:hypothetical protein